MDWSRTGSILDLLLWAAQTGLVWLGGWLVCARLFRLRRRERLPAGLAAGVLQFTLLANLLARGMDLTWAYWLAAVSVLVLGVAAVGAGGRAGAGRHVDAGGHVGPPLHSPAKLLSTLAADFTAALPGLLAFLALFLVFVRINRGLALFDDFAHLPLASMIAAGDVPPHFYLDPTTPMDYHYGMHLLAGSLVRVGGFYPWAALDGYKAFSMALATLLGVLWYRRFMRLGPAIVVGGLFGLFAGGARWLLLLLPAGWLNSLGAGVELIGSAQQTGSDLAQALAGPWRIEGDGPIPFMFAFVSGVARPLTFSMGSNSALPAMTLYLLLLLAGRRWRPWAGLVFGLLLASLALVSDHLFSILWGGIVLALLLRSLSARTLRAGRDWVWTLLPGALLVPVMGGVLTQLAARLLTPGGLGASGVALPGMALRWPPAIFSSHLGALALNRPGQVLLALVEMGPLLLLAIPVTRALPGYLRARKLLAAGLALMAIVSFCVPLMVRFIERERDITRLTGAALTIWAALGLPYAWRLYRRSQPRGRLALTAAFVSVIAGGLALFPTQLVAALQPQPSYYLNEADVAMSRAYWDRLEPGAWVLDPAEPFRPAAVFARTTGPAYRNVFEPRPEFEALLAGLTPLNAAAAGYDYIYLDRDTWSQMDKSQRDEYQRECVALIDERKTALGDFRRLYAIQDCAEQP